MMNIQKEPYVNKMTKYKTSYSESLWWRGGIFIVEITPLLTVPIEVPYQIRDWIKENIRASCRHSYENIFIMKFRSKADLVAFKLRWYQP